MKQPSIIYRLRPHIFLQRQNDGYLNYDSSKSYLNGFAGNVQFGRAGNGKWMYTTWVSWRSPGFNSNDIGYIRGTDEIQQVLWVGYRQRQPKGIFRSYGLNFNQWYGSSFGPEKIYVGVNVNGFCEFKNYWHAGMGIARNGKALNYSALRGGPALVYDGNNNIWVRLNSDYRKKIQLDLNYFTVIRDYRQAYESDYSVGLNVQTSNAFQISLSGNYRKSFDEIAYVNNIDSSAFMRYIRGT
ncbi:MAG: hypothetical protein HC906_10360 [Bacteroidales bacterium]|nr:hypothetical protein [Bacteroidales bacterium]